MAKTIYLMIFVLAVIFTFPTIMAQDDDGDGVPEGKWKKFWKKERKAFTKKHKRVLKGRIIDIFSDDYLDAMVTFDKLHSKVMRSLDKDNPDAAKPRTDSFEKKVNYFYRTVVRARLKQFKLEIRTEKNTRKKKMLKDARYRYEKLFTSLQNEIIEFRFEAYQDSVVETIIQQISLAKIHLRQIRRDLKDLKGESGPKNMGKIFNEDITPKCLELTESLGKLTAMVAEIKSPNIKEGVTSIKNKLIKEASRLEKLLVKIMPFATGSRKIHIRALEGMSSKKKKVTSAVTDLEKALEPIEEWLESHDEEDEYDDFGT